MNKTIYLHLFLICESILYFLILGIDYSLIPTPLDSINAGIRFLAVLGCLGMEVFICLFFRTSASFKILKALLAAAAADYLFLFTDHYCAAILCYCLVQWQYMQILLYNSIPVSSAFSFLLTLSFLLAVTVGAPTLLIILSALLYMIFSLFNLFWACRRLINQKGTVLFTLGLFLLFLCDIQIGLGYLSCITGFFVWMFYLPSLVCIVMSSCPFHRTQ